MSRTLTSLIGNPPYIHDAQLESRAEGALIDFYARNPRRSLALDTDRLICLIESVAQDLDVYADLSCHGPAVEGVTLYVAGKRPKVRTAAHLAEAKSDHRYRTTLAHELGHVLVHAPMFEAKVAQAPLPFGEETLHVCYADGIESPRSEFRIEWQAWAVGMAVLLPASSVRPFVDELAQEDGRYGPIYCESPLGRRIVAAVAHAYGVSTQAARIRLLRLKCLVDVVPAASLF